MARNFGENRKKSTIIRDNIVHGVYNDVCKELGEYAFLVPKAYLYERIKERTGLCIKTIAYIINHTDYVVIQNHNKF